MYISIYTFRIKTYIYGLITQECTLVHNGVGVVRQAGKARWPALWNISQSGDHMEALVYHCSWSTSSL